MRQPIFLINEGIPADRIIKVGSPMYEVLIKSSSQKIKNQKF